MYIKGENILTPFGDLFRGQFWGREQILSKANCECGNEIIAPICEIKRNRIKSCGCLKSYRGRASHSFCKKENQHPLYKVWKGMKGRCYGNWEFKTKHRYKGRGIQVCLEWLHNFRAFYEWAIENGYSNGLQLDRIDNDGDYTPTNCRFVTPKINSRNSSRVLLITIDAETRPLPEWADLYKMPLKKVYARLYSGKWDAKRALTTPLKTKKKI